MIGKGGEITVFSGSLQVCDPSRPVRDLLGGARPVQRTPAVQNLNGRDPLGCARPVGEPARPVQLSAIKTSIKFPQFPFNSSSLLEVGSLLIVLEIDDENKVVCYDFILQICK